LETGLVAHQVIEVRCQPGAAGTITNNLSALGVGTLLAFGYVGDDGLGWELRRGLRATRVDDRHLLAAADRFTPTYTKPLSRAADGTVTELNRLDIKNCRPTPPALADRVLAEVAGALARLDALIVLDQVQERNHGVVTDRAREALARWSAAHPTLPILGDSRAHLAAYQAIGVKCNQHEAAAALDLPDAAGAAELLAVARRLAVRQGRPVFITLGGDGAVAADATGAWHVPGIAVAGPVDIVGAGDSFTAGAAATLGAGGSAVEAAHVGCLVAAITVQALGTTGTATPQQDLDRLADAPW